ncbi:hypothetical protein IHE45_02G040500 [Dioscorea alata]|uniref:Uncharacterized protein n=1 Tax=Dioscorea alata TaxID=55571 RepID=A0ACB7WPS3_DIOAL|nr:hypothetical protein IHE45_02G040500 [Dioscorea alata]
MASTRVPSSSPATTTPRVRPPPQREQTLPLTRSSLSSPTSSSTVIPLSMATTSDTSSPSAASLTPLPLACSTSAWASPVARTAPAEAPRLCLVGTARPLTTSPLSF